MPPEGASPSKGLTRGKMGDIFPPMKTFMLSAVIALGAACGSLAEIPGGITVKLCGAFEQPGTYSINRKSVHLQDVLGKARPILLARSDVALVVDEGGERLVDLTLRSDDSLLRGGEQVYLYEKIIGRQSR